MLRSLYTCLHSSHSLHSFTPNRLFTLPFNLMDICLHSSHSFHSFTPNRLFTLPFNLMDICLHSSHSLNTFTPNSFFTLPFNLMDICLHSSHSLHSFTPNRLFSLLTIPSNMPAKVLNNLDMAKSFSIKIHFWHNYCNLMHFYNKKFYAITFSRQISQR